jgi:metal-dependent amidase/aminoacylase/carboxypeptidase family protein
MQDAFAIVLVVVLVAAVTGAIWAGVASRNPYARIGRGGLSLDEPRPVAPTAAALAGEREAEIRQMLEARNARRAARGQELVDVEAELAALLQARPVSADPALVAEIRELVEARNARRVRAGKPPLDVEEEVARQLRDLT